MILFIEHLLFAAAAMGSSWTLSMTSSSSTFRVSNFDASHVEFREVEADEEEPKI